MTPPFDRQEGGLREACGLFGMVAPAEADLARHAYFGLHALQHRGQEAAGIAAGDGDGRIRVVKRPGLVSQAIHDDDLQNLDPCRAVVGHVRYATSGAEAGGENDQPLAAKLASGHLALAHNGTLVNAGRLARELEGRGAIFRSSVDSEIFIHLLAHNNAPPFPEALHRACSRVACASWSMLIIFAATATRPNRGSFFSLTVLAVSAPPKGRLESADGGPGL